MLAVGAVQKVLCFFPFCNREGKEIFSLERDWCCSTEGKASSRLMCLGKQKTVQVFGAPMGDVEEVLGSCLACPVC